MSVNTIIRTSEALTAFYSENPLDFNLFDEEGQQALYIVNDESPGRTHHLVIANKSQQTLFIKEEGFLEGGVFAGPDNFHFELRFRPGTLADAYVKWINVGHSDWRVRAKRWIGEADIEDGTISLYLLFVQGRVSLAIDPQETLSIPLYNVKAAEAGGSRGSRVELRYHIQSREGQTEAVASEEDQNVIQEQDERLLEEHLVLVPIPDAETGDRGLFLYRQERLNVYNNKGIKDIPINASLVSSNTILNDGFTANELSLQLTNLLRNEYIPLCERNSENPTKFILSFDTSEKAEAWALTDNDNAAAIDLSLSMSGGRDTLWHIEKELQGQTPQWIFTIDEDERLDVGENITIELSGLITGMPSGFTNLYLLYENIPGFWDGSFVLPIEKSPLKYRDEISDQGNIRTTRVGVGTVAPTEALEVIGDVKARKLLLEDRLEVPEIHVKDAVFRGTIRGEDQAENQKKKIALHATGDLEFAGVLSAKGDLDDASEANKVEMNGADGSFTAETITARSSVTTGSLHLASFSLEETVKEIGGTDHTYLEAKEGSTIIGGFIPRGGIIMWSGWAGEVPAGWVLCEGQEIDGKTVPDLRSRFIVGAGQGKGLSSYTLDTSGDGAETNTLTEDNIPEHNHSDGDFKSLLKVNGKFTMKDSNQTNGEPNLRRQAEIKNYGKNSNDIVPLENRPPYHVLAFIMKL